MFNFLFGLMSSAISWVCIGLGIWFIKDLVTHIFF